MKENISSPNRTIKDHQMKENDISGAYSTHLGKQEVDGR
jgi:hypothetical protein